MKNAKHFGLTAGASGAANAAAIAAALNYCANTTVVGYGYSVGGPSLEVESGLYASNAPIAIPTGKQIRVVGEGADAGGGTIFQFPAGVHGVDIPQTANLMARDFAVYGGYVAAEGEFHGFHTRGALDGSGLFTFGFEGDGYNLNSTAGGSGDSAGNSNNWRLYNCRSEATRNGFYFDGADSNAGVAYGCQSNHNRQWGFLLSQFLAVTLSGCHTADNGITSHSLSICTNGSYRYYCNAGQEAWCSTNPPPADASSNQGWSYSSVGGANPTFGYRTWVTGMTWRAGGPYCTDNNNAESVIVGCYSEGGQPPSQCVQPTMVLGGTQSAGVVIYGGNTLFPGWLQSTAGGFTSHGALTANTNLTVGGTATFGGAVTISGATGELVLWDRATGSAGRWEQYVNGGILRFWQSGDKVTISPTALGLAAGVALTVAGNQVVSARGAAIAAMIVNATAGALPAADGTVTIANAAAPTNAELLEFCVEISAKQEALLSRLRAATGHGLIS